MSQTTRIAELVARGWVLSGTKLTFTRDDKTTSKLRVADLRFLEEKHSPNWLNYVEQVEQANSRVTLPAVGGGAWREGI